MIELGQRTAFAPKQVCQNDQQEIAPGQDLPTSHLGSSQQLSPEPTPVRGTVFARNDSRFYAPLCAVMAGLAAWLAAGP
jgi:hypothetical protein